MRDERFAQRCSSEVGTVIPFVALGMTALLLFLALALDQGLRYSGRTQLQQLVDASAQAAMMAFGVPGAGRPEATLAARNVAANTSVTQGFQSSDLVVTFGRYDFATSQFTPETMPMGAPQAVRVQASKAGDKAFRSLISGAPVVADADSVALLRCRNVVFVQDVSASFRDDIGKVQTALRQTVQAIRDQGGSGGIETRIGFVAFRNIVVPSATSTQLVPASSGLVDAAIDKLDDDNVLCKDSIRQVSVTRFIVPACVGSDMRSALEEAEELLEPGNGKVEACEDLILTISDGVPCLVTQQNLSQGLSGLARFADLELGTPLPGEPRGGGSTADQTLDYVNTDMRESGSIAVLTTNTSRPPPPLTFPPTQEQLDGLLGKCPQAGPVGNEQQVNSEFARKLITGFGQSFSSSRDASVMAKEMSAALQTIPPVVVR